MRSIRLPLWTLVVLAALPAPSAPATGLDHDLMPAPQTLEWRSGRLAVDPRFTIGSRGPDDGRVALAVQRFRERLTAHTGVSLPAEGKAGAPAIVIVENAPSAFPCRRWARTSPTS